MSILVPVQDLAPSLPSRIVTLKFADLLEGLPAGDETGSVTFELKGDLRVPADKLIVKAGSKTVHLDATSEGQIRLPVYSSAVKADSADGEWGILVRKSWNKQVDLIRVPAGEGPISLAEIEPIRYVSPGLGQWLLTGAGVEIVEGAQWGATVTVDGGVATFRFTVPPGGTAWFKGNLASGTDLNTLYGTARSGTYALQGSSSYLNLPPVIAGVPSTLTVDASDFSGSQEIAPYSSSFRYRRTMNNSTTVPRGWSAWERVDVRRDEVTTLQTQVTEAFLARGPLASGTDLDSMTFRNRTGLWNLPDSSTFLNAPGPAGVPAVLVNFANGVGDGWQRVIYRYSAGVYEREMNGSAWLPWRLVAGIDYLGEATARAAKGEAELAFSQVPLATMFEGSGEWSTSWAGTAFMRRVHTKYRNRFELLELGETRWGEPLLAARFGDPTKPTVMVLAGTHGDEVSSREAAMGLVRDYATTVPSALLEDVCLLVVPTMNPSGTLVSRTSRDGTDLNGFWVSAVDRPEIAAVKSLLNSHDVVAVIDGHEGGSFTQVQFGITTRPLGAQYDDSIALAGNFSSAMQAWVDASSSPFSSGVWTVDQGEETARSTFTRDYGLVYLLVEMPGMLAENIYYPDPQGRFDTYEGLYPAAITYVRDNLAAFVAAKAATGV